MSDLLSIIQETGNPNPESLSKLLGRSIEDVETELQKLRDDGALLGWVPLIHPSNLKRVLDISCFALCISCGPVSHR